MIARFVAVACALALLAVMGHIHLATKDGLERLKTFFLPAFVDPRAIVCKLLDAIHYTVVGDGHALHAILNSLVYQTRYLRLAIEDGIVGVNV